MSSLPSPFENKLHILMRDAIMPLIPDSPRLRYLLALAHLRTWKKRAHGCPAFLNRYQLYDHVNKYTTDHFDYLEFGVWKGESLNYWVEFVKDQACRFFGFDTFTGLPEKWECFAMTLESGTFDTDGELPNIQDSRLQFIKGLFQTTLPIFLKDYHPQPQLILHLDADLYSADLFVLTQLNPIIIPGTIVIFDDFLAVTHDFRALEDYCSAYIRNYEILGMTQDLHQVAIRF